MDRHDDPDVRHVPKGELHIGAIEDRGVIAIARRPVGRIVDDRLVVHRRIQHLGFRGPPWRRPGRIAQRRDMADPHPGQSQQERVAGRIVADLADELDLGLARAGRGRDGHDEAVRLQAPARRREGREAR